MLIALFAAMSMTLNAEVIEYTSDDGFKYNLDTETNTAELASYSGTATEVIVPQSITHEGVQYAVTSIGEYCFEDCTSMTSVVTPSSVTILGEGCFCSCTSLTTAEIKGDVTILDGVFSGCSSLTSVSLPSSVKTLGGFCFVSCTSLKSIDIPSSVTTLGESCFENCSSLSSINIPSSVNSIGFLCFVDCFGLKKMTVDEKNEVYDSRDNCNAIIETATNQMVWGCVNTVIPNSVTSFGYACFGGSKIESANIPSSVINLGEWTFAYCESLVEVTIPSSVTIIGEGCFQRCKSLKTMTCEIPTVIEGNFFPETPLDQATLYVPKASLDSYKSTYPWSGFGTILPIEPLDITVDTDTKEATVETAKFVEDGNVVIPASIEVDGETYTVTSIANEAFKDVEDVETVTLPRTLKEIGKGAFSGCKALKEVVVSETATNRKVSAVRYGKIQRVATRAAGDGMRIGERAFADCPVLASVTIPSTATTIGENVFNNCESLKNVTCEAVNCPTVKTFGEFPISEAMLTVPVGSLKQYGETNPWSLFGKIQDFDGTTGVNGISVYDCNDVKDVYGIDGSKRPTPAKGLNIIRMSDGTTIKVMR